MLCAISLQVNARKIGKHLRNAHRVIAQNWHKIDHIFFLTLHKSAYNCVKLRKKGYEYSSSMYVYVQKALFIKPISSNP